MIESAYKKAVAEHPHLTSIGWACLVLPPSIKPTAGKKVLAMLKKGKPAGEIASGKSKSRKWATGKNRTEANAKRAQKLPKKDNSATANSQRTMASKIGVSRATVRRILNAAGVRPLKHVRTTRNNEAKRAKRVRIANEITEMHSGRTKTNRIVWGADTWVGRGARARFNSQNERK